MSGTRYESNQTHIVRSGAREGGSSRGEIRMFGEHLDKIATVDRNDHAKCSSIGQIIRELEELASRMDHSQEGVVGQVCLRSWR